jgi:hypothetical protein
MPDPHPHDHYGRPRAPWPWSSDPTRPPADAASMRVSDAASMRVSDAERTEVTNALCRHFGDGRLDETELNDRLGLATAARTRADLAPLLADLPAYGPPSGGGPPGGYHAPPPAPRPRAPGRLGWLILAVLGFLAVLRVGRQVSGLFFVHIPWLVIAVVVIVFLRRGHHHRRRRY